MRTIIGFLVVCLLSGCQSTPKREFTSTIRATSQAMGNPTIEFNSTFKIDF
jgi:uncharacterized protein YceK